MFARGPEAGPGKPLTARELNRSVLARQGLLEPAGLPVPRMLERMAGLQAQYAPSVYVGLWSRLRALDRDAVTRGLEDRTLVQGTLMRATIHLVSREDYWPFALAVRDARRGWFQRVTRDEVPAVEMTAAAARVREAMADGPLTRRDVEALIGRPATRGIHVWLDLVRIPPAGTWERRRADTWWDAERWLGPPPEDLTSEDGLVHLVRRYLEGFGPAARADVANWAGATVRALAPALERLDLRVRRAVDGTELVDLPDAPLPGADAPAPARFLPTWDATLLTHVRRAGILPEAHRTRIFSSRNPHSFPTFLVDGSVAGTWRHEGGSVTVSPFAPLRARDARTVAAEAERVAAFHR